MHYLKAGRNLTTFYGMGIDTKKYAQSVLVKFNEHSMNATAFVFIYLFYTGRLFYS